MTDKPTLSEVWADRPRGIPWEDMRKGMVLRLIPRRPLPVSIEPVPEVEDIGPIAEFRIIRWCTKFREWYRVQGRWVGEKEWEYIDED